MDPNTQEKNETSDFQAQDQIRQSQTTCLRCGTLSSLSAFYVADIPICEACLKRFNDRNGPSLSEWNSRGNLIVFAVLMGFLLLFAGLQLSLKFFGFAWQNLSLVFCLSFVFVAVIYFTYAILNQPRLRFATLSKILDSFDGIDSIDTVRARGIQVNYCSLLGAVNDSNSEARKGANSGAERLFAGALLWNSHGLIFLAENLTCFALRRHEVLELEAVTEKYHVNKEFQVRIKTSRPELCGFAMVRLILSPTNAETRRNATSAELTHSLFMNFYESN